LGKLERIVIVGASLSGLRAAEALRQKGFAGKIVLVGAEDREPYDRPPLSKEVLRGEWEPERTALTRDGSLQELDLELRLGIRATALDASSRQIELSGGERIDFDGLVIATGATPRTLGTQPPKRGVYTLRTLDDCLAIRRDLEGSPRVAVVGAGFIGAEVAATCRSRGLDVTLVEPMPVPFGPSLGEDVGRALCDEHRDRGVDLRLGVGVSDFEGGDHVTGVQLEDGNRIDADVVIVGIGVLPETGWLESSGLELGNGVVCDATCATSLPGVVAAGDIARWPNPLFDGASMRIEHWSNAAEQARHAIDTLLAGEAGGAPFAPVPFVWSDQYDLKIQSAGYAAGFDVSKIVHGSLKERKFVKLYGRKGRLAAAVAFGEPRRLIGYRRSLRRSPSWEEALEDAKS
jgi:3-phenylpropionate/trans-cinnamate dioxygenase ferredoxin reductase subunit